MSDLSEPTIVRLAFKMVLVLACLGLWGSPLHAADRPAAAPAAPATVEQLVRELNADRFSQRQRAEQALLELGSDVLPALKLAARDPSREVRARAARVGMSIRHRALRADFQRLASKEDRDLDVEEAMWVISRVLNPNVRRDDLSKELDRLAEKVRLRMKVEPARADPQVFMATLHQVLFVEEVFAGNQADYDNPENSSLECVLATKRGLPILLSHVVIGVGQRLHAPVVGVPVVGQYVVKYDGSAAPAGFAKTDIYVNPFEGGRTLTADEVKTLLEQNDSERLALASTRRATVQRMLSNFAAHLAAKERYEEADLVEDYRQLFADDWLDLNQ